MEPPSLAPRLTSDLSEEKMDKNEGGEGFFSVQDGGGYRNLTMLTHLTQMLHSGQ